MRDLHGDEWLGRFAKTDRVEPVVTLVLYYGREAWTGARDLHQLIDWSTIPKDKKALKALAEAGSSRFQEMEEDAFDVITALTDLEELNLIKDSCMEEKGRVNMCEALRELLADERMEGRLEGKREGILEGELKGKLQGSHSKAEIVARNMFLRGMSEEDAAAICEEDIEQVRSWFAKWRK